MLFKKQTLFNKPTVHSHNITLTFITDLLTKLKSTNNTERQQSEKILSDIKYDIRLYSTLIEIAFNNNTEISPTILDLKKQSLLILKSTIRGEINQRKMAYDFSTPQNSPDLNSFMHILEYLKTQFLNFIFSTNFQNNFLLQQITDIVLLLTDKFFPCEWEELHECFRGFYIIELDLQSIFLEKFYSVTNFMCSLFYSVLKHFLKKKRHTLKLKFIKYKEKYLSFFVPYYEKMISIFEQNLSLNNFTDVSVTINILNILQTNDKILGKLIELFFDYSNFHKDEKLVYMLEVLLKRAVSIIKLMECLNTNDSNTKSLRKVLEHNLYKILKSCGILQGTYPIVFYKEIKNYAELLTLVISKCEYFEENTTKAAFFAIIQLIKEMPDLTFDKEIKKSNMKIQKKNNEMCDIPTPVTTNYDINKTPQKKRTNSLAPLTLTNVNLSLLTSPTKYRNFETERKMSHNLYHEYFQENTIVSLLECLINKCPFIYEQENESLEIEVLTEIEGENILNTKDFSTNIFTFTLLHKMLLNLIITNFTEISLKYINTTLSTLYTSYNKGNTNFNYLTMDSFYNFVNLLPILHHQNVISVTEMIDCNKYITFLENFISKSELILKRYIITLSRWSYILISNETIFKYIDNLVLFIQNINDNYILIQSCLCLKTILDSIDSIMKDTWINSINTSINKQHFKELLQTKVNWTNLFNLVTYMLSTLIPVIQSPELLVALIKLFTSLIQKSEYQNGHEMLKLLKNSKLAELTLNCKDEFRENVFSDMFKNIVAYFDKEPEVIKMAIEFGQRILKRNVSTTNLQFIDFVIKASEKTEETKKIFYEFICNNNNIFNLNLTSSQSLSVIVCSILEEITLFDILNDSDLINIVDMICNKYIATFEQTQNLVKQTLSNETTLAESMKTNIKVMLTDLCEVKSNYLKALNTFLLYFGDEKGIDITTIYKQILLFVLNEIILTFNSYDIEQEYDKCFSYELCQQLNVLIVRIALYNFNLFQEILVEVLNERTNSYDVNTFFYYLFLFLGDSFNKNTRKINALFVCKILPMLNYEFLLKSHENILFLCLDVAYNDLMENHQGMNDSNKKKLKQQTLDETILRSKVRLNMPCSIRKKKLFEDDKLNTKYDVYFAFKESVLRVWRTFGKRKEDFIRDLKWEYESNRKDQFLEVFKDIP